MTPGACMIDVIKLIIENQKWQLKHFCSSCFSLACFVTNSLRPKSSSLCISARFVFSDSFFLLVFLQFAAVSEFTIAIGLVKRPGVGSVVLLGAFCFIGFLPVLPLL
jgi:hypothetical protein